MHSMIDLFMDSQMREEDERDEFYYLQEDEWEDERAERYFEE
ncbi:hypothetical protein NQ016_03890 [Staphylococcus hyicus]|nr:hypothetical protein [Staphylococcus hyicus]MCQ9290659.1 hypothetical protein [Staphylococcus hyicus]MCQ9305901.1 hypothetical protein [Staphylococcus hyicus]MCQ9308313.1 hypothetical protein [Staphylococcus hyicus]MCQ9310735.1 hypothetical protein [Staphylococcus hyicus]